MEELNKTQIILLAIFITLVTSVATGVVVVTLMDQAPQGITQTVNRVVERTVERVVSPGKVEQTEIKQIIKEDDTIVSSVKNAKQSLVRVFRKGNPAALTSIDNVVASENQTASLSGGVDGSVLALGDKLALGDDISRTGFIVSTEGIVVTSNEVVGGPDSVYYAMLGETKQDLKFIKADNDSGIAIFSMDPAPKGATALNALSIDQVSLGKTVITLGFDSGLNTLAMGYVSGIKQGDASTTPIIRTSIRPTENWSGRPIVDINGFLIGMYGADNTIVPYISIKNLIDSSLSKKTEGTASSTKSAL